MADDNTLTKKFVKVNGPLPLIQTQRHKCSNALQCQPACSSLGRGQNRGRRRLRTWLPIHGICC